MTNRTIGLVGCGRWGALILRDLVQLGVDVVVVARTDASRGRATDGGAAAIVGAVDELPEVEGAVVATTTTTHALVLDELLEREMPIFVEKPLTADPTGARRLAMAAPDRVFVMDKWRYHPGVEELAGIARSGELGEVLTLRTTRVGWGHPHSDVDAIWMLAPHDLSIGLEVLGALPSPAAASAERLDGTPTGLIGFLGDEPSFVVEVSVRSTDRRREVRLQCAGGVAVLPDGYSDHIVIARGPDDGTPPTVERRAVSTELPLQRELQAFLAHVAGGPAPRSSAADGASVVEAVAALRRLAGIDGPEDQ